MKPALSRPLRPWAACAILHNPSLRRAASIPFFQRVNVWTKAA